MAESIRQYLQRRWADMKSERSSWDPVWRECNEYTLPRASRFNSYDKNRGTRRDQKIINSEPSMALRTLASGLQAGMSSPGRPWFRLQTDDPDLDDFQPVREWCRKVEDEVRKMFSGSNFYNTLHRIYHELAGPGTAAAFLEEDLEDGIRGYLFPLGQYALSNSARGNVDTVYREFSMTVGQMVEYFGRENCSGFVKGQYDKGNYGTWVDGILHAVEPNRDRDTKRSDYAGKKWKSCWLETQHQSDGKDGLLKESGYDRFPGVAPRWDTWGEDIYGSSPTMLCIGDVKALQLYEKRKAMAIEKFVNPPMKAPSSLRTGRSSSLPGDVTYVDETASGTAFSPAYQVDPRGIQFAESSIDQHVQRARRAYFADLWQALLEADKPMTAREVAERHEEKMILLGPVLERLQDELYEPAIDIAFDYLDRRGKIPPPPEELHGVKVGVQYTSILAQAQQLLEIAPMDRLVSVVGSLASVYPDGPDKLNSDKFIDEYAKRLGTKPDLMRSEEEVNEIRAERAAQMKAKQAGEAMMNAAQGAKTLSETDVGSDSALTRLTGVLGGVAAGSAGVQ